MGISLAEFAKHVRMEENMIADSEKFGVFKRVHFGVVTVKTNKQNLAGNLQIISESRYSTYFLKRVCMSVWRMGLGCSIRRLFH